MSEIETIGIRYLWDHPTKNKKIKKNVFKKIKLKKTINFNFFIRSSSFSRPAFIPTMDGSTYEDNPDLPTKNHHTQDPPQVKTAAAKTEVNKYLQKLSVLFVQIPIYRKKRGQLRVLFKIEKFRKILRKYFGWTNLMSHSQ